MKQVLLILVLVFINNCLTLESLDDLLEDEQTLEKKAETNDNIPLALDNVIDHLNKDIRNVFHVSEDNKEDDVSKDESIIEKRALALKDDTMALELLKELYDMDKSKKAAKDEDIDQDSSLVMNKEVPSYGNDIGIALDNVFDNLKKDIRKVFHLKSDVQEDDQCKDENESECIEKAIAGECSKSVELMKNKCTRSCGYCCADHTTLSPSCAQKRGYCKSTNFKLREQMKVMCPVTCGYCGESNKAFAEVPCANSDFGCCWDGSIAKGPIGQPGDGCPACVEQYGTLCSRFKGDCSNPNTQGKQIIQFCPKTCGVCGPNKVCADRPDMGFLCERMKNEGKCETNYHYMKLKCDRTCGFCTLGNVIDNSKKDIRTVFHLKSDVQKDDQCKDENESECIELAFAGECSKSVELMKNKCTRSCGYCCADHTTLSPSCAQKRGYCKSPISERKEKMKVMCPVTCGYCGDSNKAFAEVPCANSDFGCCWDGSIAKGPIGQPGDGCPACVDQYGPLCSRFKGDCSNPNTQGKQIIQVCPKTCGVCGPNKVCADRPDMGFLCERMKNEGKCETNYHYMKLKCDRTCGFCK